MNTCENEPMADNKKGPNRKADARFELRLKQELLERVERQAERLGINATNYIRQAVTLQLEQDEATQPKAD